MSRSLKNLYPEKYQEYLNSDMYKYKNSIQKELKELSALCKKNADYKCEVCGEPAIDAHHIIPLEEGGQNTLDNLICVCRACHRQIHKGVYKYDENSKKFMPSIIQEHIIPNNVKPNYIREFEKMLGTTIYKNSGGYYAFVNNIKVKYDVSAIKAAVGYTGKREAIQETESMRIKNKKKSIRDRKLLEQYKQMFKEAGNKTMWHEICTVIKNWDKFDTLQQEHIFDTLHKFFDKYGISY
jgi:ribosomal protein L37AE/L43A